MSDVVIEPWSQQNMTASAPFKEIRIQVCINNIQKYPRELWRTPYYLSIDLSFCQRGKEYYYYIRSYGRATSAASYDKKHSSQFPSACKTWRSRRHLSLPLILTNDDSSRQDITGPLFQQNITGRMCHCCIHFHLIHSTTGIRILCHYPLVSNN